MPLETANLVSTPKSHSPPGSAQEPGRSFCEHVEGAGLAFFDVVAKAGLEGMVAKDGSSVYREGRRSDCWLMVKASIRQEAATAGTRGRTEANSIRHPGSGPYEDGELIHIGAVDGGFSARTLASVFAQLKPLCSRAVHFRTKPKTKEPATGVRPELVCEVRFTAWTGGHLRHPIFIGKRADER
jgi:bifunctional non-homologous end joining protein LigD